MTLPNADRAIIDPSKLTDDCLSETHSVGRHKAKVFRSALGLTAVDAPYLELLIRAALPHHPATAGRADEFGQRYQVDLPITTPAGSAVVRTAWIVRTGEDVPRMTTCYVL